MLGLLGLRTKKEEADKEVGWPDPNPGATQLDLPTGICPHAPLHSSYPPSPSRYARMLRQPHECHFKLHTGASLMDSRTTQAGGIYDKIFLQERKFQSIILGASLVANSSNNFKSVLAHYGWLMLPNLYKSELGIEPWW